MTSSVQDQMSAEQRLCLEQAVARIATRFVGLTKLDEAIDATLACAGGLARADRAYLLQFGKGGTVINITHEWCASGISAQISNRQNLPSDGFRWITEKLRGGGLIEIENLAALPTDASEERKVLEALAIRSCIFVPIQVADVLIGVMGFDNPHAHGGLRAEEIELFTRIGRLMGSALEREQVRGELQLSASLQQAILENIPDIAWLKDAQGYYLAVNQPFARYCGVSAEELLGKTDLDIWSAEPARKYRADDAIVMQSRKPGRLEERLPDRHLGERWVETIKTPITDARGEVVGTAGIARDITARKQIELALRESEERYRRLVEGVPAIVYQYVTDRGASYWSPQVEAVLGFSTGDLAQNPYRWHDAIHPEDLPEVDKAIAEFQVGKPIDLEYRIRDEHGKWHWFHDKSVGRRTLDQETIIEGIATDITERKEMEQALRESEEKYRLLVEEQSDMVVQVDLEGRFQFVSPSYCQTFGKTEKELLGATFMPLVHEDDREKTAQAMEALFDPPYECYVEQRALTATGWRWLGWADKAVLDEQGKPVAVVGVGRDISERKAVEEALYQEREKAQVTLHSIGDAVITTDAIGRVELLNPVAEALTGWGRDEAKGQRLTDVFRVMDEQTRQPVEDPIARVLREGRIVGLAAHTLLIGRDGTEYAIEESAAPIRDHTGVVLGVVLVFKDVTEQRHLSHRMLHQATHDSLTDLVNRAEFESRLDQAIGAFHLHGTPYALCYLDLDQFKVVNDTAGHSAGDEMLIQIASLLKTRIRSRDTLARLGGDEFSLLLENCPLGNALEIAEDVVAAVGDFRFTWQERRFAIGVSVGVVPITVDISERGQLMTRADVACFTAKDMGRNRVYLYQSGDSELSQRHHDILRAAELREALEKDRFRLYAQPICDAGDPDGRILHHEVLVRLLDTDGKLLLPGSFIAAAERFGIMVELDRWVIRQALRQFSDLRLSSQDPGIAINLSGSSLSDDRLVGFVQACLASSGVQARQVCFELTETTAISRLAVAQRLITELRKLGCRFALDDFGSGLSSFTYLKHLPVDYLKIDGSFVRDAHCDAVDRAMVKAINEIGHTMGIATVAESVETEESLAVVRQIGVDFVQGYAVGHPHLLEDLTNRSKSRSA
jgi:diguanylate cyclase (GGDEF)-like protein/PAS domain S-box-containing protein